MSEPKGSLTKLAEEQDEILTAIAKGGDSPDSRALARAVKFWVLQMGDVVDTLEGLPTSEEIGDIVEAKLKKHGNGNGNGNSKGKGVALTVIKRVKFFKWEFIGYSWFEVIMMLGVFMVFGLVLQEMGVIDGCTGFVHKLLGHDAHK